MYYDGLGTLIATPLMLTDRRILPATSVVNDRRYLPFLRSSTFTGVILGIPESLWIRSATTCSPPLSRETSFLSLVSRITSAFLPTRKFCKPVGRSSFTYNLNLVKRLTFYIQDTILWTNSLPRNHTI